MDNFNKTAVNLKTNKQEKSIPRIGGSVKQPSYLNLACCISGYTTLTTYNSKEREAFRSRDNSAAKITGISRHSADHGSKSAVFTSLCGKYLSPQPRYLTKMDHRKKGGDIMSHEKRTIISSESEVLDVTDNHYTVSTAISDMMSQGTPSTVSIATSDTDKSNVKDTTDSVRTSESNMNLEPTSYCGLYFNSGLEMVGQQSLATFSGSENTLNDMGATSKLSPTTFTIGPKPSTNYCGIPCHYNTELQEVPSTLSSDALDADSVQTREVTSQGSLFILQRVERLYGPGALAQGFYRRRSRSAPASHPQSVSKKENEVVEDTSKESALPVLKLLRPEFRAQLKLASRKSNSPCQSPSRRLTQSDDSDGYVERSIPVVMESSEESLKSEPFEKRETAELPIVKDGHYFLKLVLDETTLLERNAADLEAEVNSVPEHMEGRIRAAAGKARLLASQKLAQFKGLCLKNINQDRSEDFPTTCEDLAGFWDMVSIQITIIHEEFDQIEILRKAGWEEKHPAVGEIKKGVLLGNGTGASQQTKSILIQPKARQSDIDKTRDEARKKMLAERRKEMKKNRNSNDDIVMF